MPDVQNIDLLAFLCDPVNHTVDMGLVPIEQMPELGILWGFRTTVWLILQAQDRFLEAEVPFEGAVGTLGVDRRM